MYDKVTTPTKMPMRSISHTPSIVRIKSPRETVVPVWHEVVAVVWVENCAGRALAHTPRPKHMARVANTSKEERIGIFI